MRYRTAATTARTVEWSEGQTLSVSLLAIVYRIRKECANSSDYVVNTEIASARDSEKLLS